MDSSVKMVDPYSLQSYYTEIFFNDLKLSEATSFVYELDRKKYLITNWHVVSGKNAFTEKVLDKNAAIPNRLKVYVPQRTEDGYIRTGILSWNIPLYCNMEDMLDKRWYDKKNVSGGYIDIAAIPLSEEYIPPEVLCITINESDIHSDYKLHIADDIFVIGYPLGLHEGMLPIWKRATVASEPQIGINNQRRFYVDTATREGMSGSPVVSIKTGFLKKMGPGRTYAQRKKFVGIYSGRVGVNNNKPDMAHLGIVWEKELIDEIICENSKTE